MQESLKIPPYTLSKKGKGSAPIVVASAHSGTHYPAALTELSDLKIADFRRFEDAAVDKLFSFVPNFEIPFLTATYARVWVDLNRAPDELDPAMYYDSLPAARADSPRVQSGLGVIPRYIAPNLPVYKSKLRFDDVKKRLDNVYAPYHAVLFNTIRAHIARFGKNLLIDAHSMPDLPPDRLIKGKTPDFVLGDVDGSSCAPEITRFAAETLREMGYFVTVNLPYAGAYATKHYGRPAQNSHALQVEIARHLYWDAEKYEKTAYFDTLWHHLCLFIDKMRRFMQD